MGWQRWSLPGGSAGSETFRQQRVDFAVAEISHSGTRASDQESADRQAERRKQRRPTPAGGSGGVVDELICWTASVTGRGVTTGSAHSSEIREQTAISGCHVSDGALKRIQRYTVTANMYVQPNFGTLTRHIRNKFDCQRNSGWIRVRRMNSLPISSFFSTKVAPAIQSMSNYQEFTQKIYDISRNYYKKQHNIKNK